MWPSASDPLFWMPAIRRQSGVLCCTSNMDYGSSRPLTHLKVLEVSLESPKKHSVSDDRRPGRCPPNSRFILLLRISHKRAARILD